MTHRLLVAGICAGVVLTVFAWFRDPRQPRPSPELPAGTEAGDHWHIEVDGWTMEFDSVRGADFPALADAGTGAADGTSFTSPYDELIREHAARAGLDWRLVSAVAFVASGYDENRQGTDEAFGLMQVRADMAAAVAEPGYFTAESNLRVGSRYLARLIETSTGASQRDRLAFALAAYRLGQRHVEDACALASRFGYDRDRWEGSVALILPLLEQPAIARLTVAGLAPGAEAVAFVQSVLDRYDQHRGLIEPALPQARGAANGRGESGDRTGGTLD